MTQEEAQRLIQHPAVTNIEPTTWADLGAGAGTFTLALAKLLSPGSRIYAVDRNAKSLHGIPSVDGVHIEKIRGDFTSTGLVPGNLNGILMANALHFVEDKLGLLKQLSAKLSAEGVFLIVEYDLPKSNVWIPYPIPYAVMENLFANSLGKSVKKLGEIPSKYNRSMIYGALIM